jgi:signal transduction histidine kinase
MTTENALGLLLDIDGNITEIISDAHGLIGGITAGMPFARLAASGSLAKALSFITQIRKEGVAFDWEFNIATDQPRSLHFTGGKVGDRILVVAALNGAVALHYYEEMMRINNEQTNTLRQVYGELQRDTNLYDEVSRLNNELVDMQRELAKKNAQLTQLNQEKNRFLGIAAHDLRNPLHAILMLSDFLLDECTEGEQKEFLEEIRSSSTFMARLIDDLLDVAKIESGQVALELAMCDINDLLEATIKRQNLMAARKQVEINLVGQPVSPALIDISKIEQVLNNLIGNALKFSLPGGQIDVRVRAADERFEIEVQDWGVGIPPEIQSRLFTAFAKGQTGTAGERSTGLGLVIVKRIVQAHGGEIHVESRLGEGSTFTVQLPIRPQQMAETA